MSSTTYTKTYAYAEFSDDAPSSASGYAGVRVTLADKLQFERTAKARKWHPERDAMTVSAFLAFCAGRRAGLHELTWEDFQNAVIDAGVIEPSDDDADDDSAGDDLGPTNPAPGTNAP